MWFSSPNLSLSKNLTINFVKFSTKSKAYIIKNLNYENKTLYGPAIKINKNKKGKTITTVNNSNSDKNNEKSYESERFWLIEFKKQQNQDLAIKNENNNKNKITYELSKAKSIKIESIKESLSNIKAAQSKFPKNESDFEIKRLLSSSIPSSSTKEKKSSPLQTEILSSIQNSNLHQLNEIPFNENELKSILKFPLILNDNTNFNVNINNTLTTSNNTTAKTILSYKLPSVGKILQATMSEKSRNALINWKLSKINELGQDGFDNLQKELLTQGKLFHKALQEYLVSFKSPQLDSNIEGVWNSVISAIETLKPQTKLIEAPIQHPYLKYCGIVDYVSHIGSNLSIIEWKKSNKIKNHIDLTYDAPIQLCAYLGALNFDERYQIKINCGYVIIAYTNGQPAQIHYLDKIELEKYWKEWLYRLQEYWIRYKDGTLPEPI